MITSITINFTPCPDEPVEGYNILYRAVDDVDYIDAGNFISSPAVISVSYPDGTQFEGIVKSPCGDVQWSSIIPSGECTCRFGVAGEDDTAAQNRLFTQVGYTFDIVGNESSYWNFYYQNVGTGAFADVYIDSTQVFLEANDGAGQDAYIYVSPAEIDFSQTAGSYNFANLQENLDAPSYVVSENGYIYTRPITPPDGCTFFSWSPYPPTDDDNRAFSFGGNDMMALTDLYLDKSVVYPDGANAAFVDAIAAGMKITITLFSDPTVKAVYHVDSVASTGSTYNKFNVTLVSSTGSHTLVQDDVIVVCTPQFFRFAVPGEDDAGTQIRTFTMTPGHTINFYGTGEIGEGGGGFNVFITADSDEGGDGSTATFRVFTHGSETTSIYLEVSDGVTSTQFHVNLGSIQIFGLGDFADDTAATAGGVPTRGMYTNGSQLMLRAT